MQSTVDTIIRTNTGLVYKQLHRFYLLNDNEAESIAFEALWKAACDYDCTKGTKFSTLATVYIYNALCGYIRKLKAKNKIEYVSYNKLIGDDQHEYLELLASDENVAEDLEYEEFLNFVATLYDEALLAVQNDKHRRILKIWRDKDFNCSATHIANEAGVSQSYVSQVLSSFKYKFRCLLEDTYGISRGNYSGTR